MSQTGVIFSIFNTKKQAHILVELNFYQIQTNITHFNNFQPMGMESLVRARYKVDQCMAHCYRETENGN